MIAIDEHPVGTGAQEAAFGATRAPDDLRATQYALLNAQGQGSIDETSIRVR